MRVVNRQARRHYQILEKIEAGVSLTGAEVKSIKQGRIRLDQAFVRVKDGQAWLLNAEVSPFKSADSGFEPKRARRLLLHKNEILSLEQKVRQKRLTVVPIACYTKGRQIKLSLALARGKKEYEKRQALKEKDIKREMERELR